MPDTTDDGTLLQDLADWTFAGLSLYYRDTELSARQLGKYRVNLYLRNNFFVDVTDFSEGLAGSTRYLIASSKAAPLYQVAANNPDLQRWRLHVLNANSCFKVLDVFTLEQRTQILLLHVPRLWARLLPEGTPFPVEGQLIARGRQHFAEKLARPPSPELQDPEWKKRVQFAVGLDDQDRLMDVARPVELGGHPLYQAIEKLVGDKTNLNK